MPAPAARFTWRTWLALLALSVAYPLAQSTAPGRWSSAEPDGYYAALTEAFRAGQLHLKASPDPRLAQLADPYLGDQGVPRLHDAIYYEGRYYLYFGPAPVLLLYLPWLAATGHYLSDGAGTAVFSLAAFLLGAGLLARLRARYFPALGEGWFIASLVAWGLGNNALVLASSPAVYSVPITCAIACLLAGCWAGLLALDRPAPLRWLLAGSLACGLAVAARPNYLVGLGGWLLLLLAALRANARRAAAERVPALRLAAAGLLPLIAVGIALAAYNGLRFGSIFDFGVRYMLAGGDQRNLPIFALERLGPGLATLLAEPVGYQPYFPFAAVLDAGVLLVAPVLGLLLIVPWLAWRATTAAAWWRIGAPALLAASAGTLATIALLPTQHYRYRADFLPGLLLVALTVAWALLDPAPNGTRRRRAGLSACIGLLLAAGIAHALAAQAELLNLTARAPGLVRALNLPAAWIARATGREPGPVVLRGRPPAAPYGTTTPLVVTGRGQDILYLRHVGPGDTRVGFFHAGTGGPESNPLDLPTDRDTTFEVELGSFYPPPEHPFFAGWDPRAVAALRRRVLVRVDGRVVLDGASAFAPSHPWDIRYAANPRGLLTGPVAPGRPWFNVERRPAPRPEELSRLPQQPLRLQLRFPDFIHFKREPLLGTGGPGRGDLVYVVYPAPGRLRLGHDSWDGGSIESREIVYEPGRDYTLDIDLGSLHPAPPGERFEAKLRVNWDGEPLLDARRPFHASLPLETVIGYNAIGSSAAYATFTGHVSSVTPLAEFPRPAAAFGAVALTVRFPVDRTGAREPLVVTGRTGAGDFIYVEYTGPGILRFGYDHWGVGGPLGEPVAIDPTQPHRLEISLGSLYPPLEDNAAWADLPVPERTSRLGRVEVRLDGRLVLAHAGTAHPAAPDEVALGANPLGGSTCDAAFTGRIEHTLRLPPGARPADAP